jgi:1-hydroxycarotenoid 3,4-desaturase
MHRVARAFEELATAKGARFRYEAEVAEILVGNSRATGIRLADGEVLEADAIICNADVAALAGGRFGGRATRAVEAVPRATRSLSAMTWAMVAPTEGFPLVRHNVFFSPNSRTEFDELTEQGRVPSKPTVYVCAQDRGEALRWRRDVRRSRLVAAQHGRRRRAVGGEGVLARALSLHFNIG